MNVGGGRGGGGGGKWGGSGGDGGGGDGGGDCEGTQRRASVVVAVGSENTPTGDVGTAYGTE